MIQIAEADMFHWRKVEREEKKRKEQEKIEQWREVQRKTGADQAEVSFVASQRSLTPNDSVWRLRGYNFFYSACSDQCVNNAWSYARVH